MGGLRWTKVWKEKEGKGEEQNPDKIPGTDADKRKRRGKERTGKERKGKERRAKRRKGKNEGVTAFRRFRGVRRHLHAVAGDCGWRVRGTWAGDGARLGLELRNAKWKKLKKSGRVVSETGR